MELAYGLDKVLLETIPKLEHGHDGLIFTRVDSPYVIGEDNNMQVSITCFAHVNESLNTLKQPEMETPKRKLDRLQVDIAVSGFGRESKPSRLDGKANVPATRLSRRAGPGRVHVSRSDGRQ
jgi:hypothetical protein